MITQDQAFDVIVAGGGVAGVAAALAARRAGKTVLLLEKSITLGGLSTLGLVNYFVPMCNGRGKQIIRGMAEEFLRLSIAYGYDTLPAPWKLGEPTEPTNLRYVTDFSPTLFALALTEKLLQEGVALLYDCAVTQPEMQGGHCTGVWTESKSGRVFYAARFVVDATGDGDLLRRAGVPTVQGFNYYTYYGYAINQKSCQKAAASGNIHDAYIRTYGGRASLYGKHHPEGMPRFAGTTAEAVTDYLLKNQQDMLNALKDQPRMERDIAILPGMAQFRTTCHIDGDYTLTTDDQYQHFDDSISAICDFDHRDILYEVPYRCLKHRDYDNLITAGRSAAAAGYAWDVLRVIPPAIVTGQAAGEAAALALDTGKNLHTLDIRVLQERLAAADVMIHFDDSLIPAVADNTREETQHI